MTEELTQAQIDEQAKLWDGGSELIDRTPSVNDIPDNELLQRVIRNLYRRGRSREKLPLWSIVGTKFNLGSGYACELCRRFGLNPDEMVKR